MKKVNRNNPGCFQPVGQYGAHFSIMITDYLIIAARKAKLSNYCGKIVNIIP